ncbi:MAG: glycosyltransferase family 4 protein [bacterium]|nr:glycosyltransferase family 4 protein [bacterium]
MNKRVLIFSFAYYPYVGGAEVAIKEITDRLPGIVFDLITFNLGDEKAEDRIGNVNVYRIKTFTKYLYPIKSFFKGMSLHRANKYDAVWAMMANAGFPALFLKILFPKIKYVLSIQEGDPIPQIKRRVWFAYPIFVLVFKTADKVAVLSNYLADFAKSMGSKMVEVIPNGVDLNKFRVKSFKVIKPEDKIVLVTTSRLVKKNAVGDIIRALKFLPGNLIFKCVGSGPDERGLKSLVKELDLEARVEFIGHTEHSIMAEILRNSDIFIRPSLSEGLGSSFLEAMAVGLPIIATNVGGIPDFLTDGETGLFCKVGDSEDVARKVMRLVQDSVLYSNISGNSIRLIKERYNWDDIAKKYEQFFT